MKKTITIILILVVLAGMAWLIASSRQEDSQEQRVALVEKEVSFNCADGKSFIVGYSDDVEIATLSLSDERQVTLERAISASGARYTNDSGFVFWNKGDGAFIEENGEMTYENCIVVGAESDSEDIEVVGTITNIDETQAMVDGPYIVEVALEGGNDTARILIPSMGILLCEARDNIADISDLEEGMTVEARGAVSGDDGGSITPCESEDHYLRIVSE